MVRINLISPRRLTDQHLVAEYAEILMLAASMKKFKSPAPKEFCLGKGHQLFFKDKLLYLKKRHELLKIEMVKRGFKPVKSLDISRFTVCKCWKSSKKDESVVIRRLMQKIRMKPGFYRYYGRSRSQQYLLKLINASKQ